MTQVVSRKLPHGAVSSDNIGNENVREAVLYLSENVVSLKKEIATLQKAVVELQRR